MPRRAIISALCVAPILAAHATAMPAAPVAATAFMDLTILLPCQPDIAALAYGLGYREVAQTRIDTDYADIEFSDAANHSRLTVAFEDTPIGAQFSVVLDIPETDQAYADTLVTALRRDWSLPETTKLKDLASGTAQFWNIEIPNGTAQITVRHDNMTTQISGILAPLKQGIPLPC